MKFYFILFKLFNHFKHIYKSIKHKSFPSLQALECTITNQDISILNALRSHRTSFWFFLLNKFLINLSWKSLKEIFFVNAVSRNYISSMIYSTYLWRYSTSKTFLEFFFPNTSEVKFIRCKSHCNYHYKQKLTSSEHFKLFIVKFSNFNNNRYQPLLHIWLLSLSNYPIQIWKQLRKNIDV